MSKKTIVVQCDLRHGSSLMTCWLDKRSNLKEGVKVELKEFKGCLWDVVKVYSDEHETSDFDFHHGWDNNNYDKHKGLGL